MASGLTLHSSLGILTLEELFELSDLTLGKGRVPVVDLLLEDLKIIEVDSNRDTSESVSSEEQDLTITKGESNAEDQGDSKGVLFILDSWRKTKHSKDLIRQQEILKLYELNRDFSPSSDYSESTACGLLVNKKQF